MNALDQLYDAAILDHIKNARNYGELPRANLRANGSNVLCGDILTVQLVMDGERIRDVGFVCSCCGISMASASIMTETVKGKRIQEARAAFDALTTAIESQCGHVGSAFGPGPLDALTVVRQFPARINCALLGWRTLIAALDGQEEVLLPLP